MISKHWKISDEYASTTIYVNVHHNGDYSGDVIINKRVVPAGLSEKDTMKLPFEEIEIPASVILDLAAAYILRKRLEKLESATTEEILS